MIKPQYEPLAVYGLHVGQLAGWLSPLDNLIHPVRIVGTLRSLGGDPTPYVYEGYVMVRGLWMSGGTLMVAVENLHIGERLTALLIEHAILGNTCPAFSPKELEALDALVPCIGTTEADT